jgi:hypothetical protein
MNEEVLEGVIFGVIFVAGLWFGFFFMHPAY